MKRNLLAVLFLFGLLSCNGAENETHRPDIHPGMCAKEKMAADGIVRLSKIEVYPKYLDEYVKYVTEIGEISLRTEPGVLDEIPSAYKSIDEVMAQQADLVRPVTVFKQFLCVKG